MAVVAFTDGRVYAGGVNLSGYANQAQLEITANELDRSSISSTWDETVLGRRRASFESTSFWEAGAGKPDSLFDNLGLANQVLTLLPDGDDGGVGYSVQAVAVQHTVGAPAGELMTVQFSARGDISRAIRGTVMHDDVTSRTSSSTGTIRQLGAVGATQRVYAALHVLSVSGTSPTLDVTVESDNAVGFPSAATQLTFTQKTAAGAEWKSSVGAITDDYWRVKWVIGGSATPTFQFVVVVAIH
jgi:hypothetical protein